MNQVVAPDRIAARLRLEYARNAADPWYAIHKGYVFTEDEKRVGEMRPFPDWRYLHILTRLWQLYPIGIVVKARQMILSWLFCWLNLHQTLYHPGSLNILQGKRLDDIKAVGTKSLMGRTLFMYRHLPDWLKPELQVRDDENAGKRTLTSLVVPGGGVLIAAPQGADIVRSKTASSLTMDELAFHPEGSDAWNASLPTVNDAEPIMLKENPDWLLRWNERFPDLAADFTKGFFAPRMWGVTTPNGMDPLVYPMAPWEPVQGSDHGGWKTWRELTGFTYEDGSPVDGMRLHLKRQEYEGYSLPPMACVALHYTADYRPDAWARRRASRATYDSESAYERENELSFRSAAGTGVFRPAEFGQRHLEEYKPVVWRPTIISMDTGYQGQSACFHQETMLRVGEFYWRRTHTFHHRLWKARTLDEVLYEIKTILAQYGIPLPQVRFVTDWNTLTTHHGGVGITDMQIFHQHGIYPVARRVGPNQKDQAINLARRALKVWPDGIPGALVDPKGAPMVVQMLDGGWRYAAPVPGKGFVETPHKDGTFDHVGDSYVYRWWALEQEVWHSRVAMAPDSGPPDSVDSIRRAVMQTIKNKRRDATEPVGRGVGPGGLAR